jgi:regulator of sigma E protease
MDMLYTIAITLLTLAVLVASTNSGISGWRGAAVVKVLRFSIGFGKPLAALEDRLGTEYVVAAIPSAAT